MNRKLRWFCVDNDKKKLTYQAKSIDYLIIQIEVYIYLKKIDFFIV